MNISNRKKLFSFLVISFFIQGLLVYSDPEETRSTQFSQSAFEGKKIWLKHNCQSCHQIYGFGGFLGPDLTNKGGLWDAHDLQEKLASGSEMMPSVVISLSQAHNLRNFFKAMDQTGQSVAKSSSYQSEENKLKLSSVPWFIFKGQSEQRK